jgi:hypothetical protein
MKKAIFFWLLFLAGCAPQRMWFNPTRNFSQSQADLHDCQHSGGTPAPNGAGGERSEQPEGESDPVSSCMKARGYYLVDMKYADAYRSAE